MEDNYEKFLLEVEEIERNILDYSLTRNINGNKEIVRRFLSEVKKAGFLNGDVFRAESDLLVRLLPSAAVSIGVYDKEKNVIIVKAISGLQSFFESLIKFAGINLVGKEFPLEDSLANVMLSSGKIHKVPKGLKDAALKKVPDAIVSFLDDLLGPFFVYSGGIIYKGDLIGDVVVILREVSIDGDLSELIDRLLPLFGIINYYYLKK
jgi:hypothetical protein